MSYSYGNKRKLVLIIMIIMMIIIIIIIIIMIKTMKKFFHLVPFPVYESSRRCTLSIVYHCFIFPLTQSRGGPSHLSAPSPPLVPPMRVKVQVEGGGGCLGKAGGIMLGLCNGNFKQVKNPTRNLPKYLTWLINSR